MQQLPRCSVEAMLWPSRSQKVGISTYAQQHLQQLVNECGLDSYNMAPDGRPGYPDMFEVRAREIFARTYGHFHSDSVL